MWRGKIQIKIIRAKELDRVNENLEIDSELTNQRIESK